MLSSSARRVLAQGCSVVLDAAYLQEAERTEIAHLAATCGVRFVGLFLTADLATRLARIEQRTDDASDATRNVALKQETFTIGAVNWHMIDASGTPAQSLRSALLHCRAGKGCELTMATATRPTGTSSRRKANGEAAPDCATALQKMALGSSLYQGPSHERLRRRCRGRASDPGRDHEVVFRRGVLCADRGRCGVAAAEEGNDWLNGPLGAARDSDVVVDMRAANDTAMGGAMLGARLDSARSGSPPSGSLPSFRSGATPGRGPRAGSDKDRGWSATNGARIRRLWIPIARANRELARTAGPQGRNLKRWGRHAVTGCDQGQTLPLHAGSTDGNCCGGGAGRTPSPSPPGKTGSARIGRHARYGALRWLLPADLRR